MRAREASLTSAFSAAVQDANDDAPCIDMMYHSRISIENTTVGDFNNDNSSDSDDDGSISGSSDEHKSIPISKIHTALRSTLEEGKVPNISLVYLTIQGVLIYDRYRGGLTFTENEERYLLFGDAIVDDVSDANLDIDEGQREPMRLHEQLTHNLLDEILSYCDDEAAAILPQVCASWRDEAGTRSPSLWKILLDRHGWPLVENGEVGGKPDDDVVDECKNCRDTFVSHYTVVRDAKALAAACNYMNGDEKRPSKLGVESALQVFKATKGAPNLDDPGLSHSGKVSYCSVKIWSDNKEGASTRALAAYYDCSLRLFDVIGGDPGSVSKGTIKCRQIVCARAAPPSSSRKKGSCTLRSMDMDDNVVACFVEETREKVVAWPNDLEGENGSVMTDELIPWITVFSRDNILCAGNEGTIDDECIRSFDIRGAIIDYLLSGDADPDEPLRECLNNYLSIHDQHSTEDVGMTVTPKLIACGAGHFLFKAYIIIPGYTEGTSDVGNRLFIFSTQKGGIVKSFHMGRDQFRASLFASRPFRCGAKATCTNILVHVPSALFSLSVVLQRDGTIDVQQKSMQLGVQLENEERYLVNAVVTSTHSVLAIDRIGLEGHHICFQSLQFSDFHKVEITGRKRVARIFLIGENHVAAVISSHRRNNEGDENDVEDESSEMAVYHIPTCQEIYRRPFPSESISVDYMGGTLALNLSNIGFVITGGNAREVARSALIEDSAQITSPSGKNPKGKKKRLASLASGRKKDGFARGQSLRG